MTMAIKVISLHFFFHLRENNVPGCYQSLATDSTISILCLFVSMLLRYQVFT